MKNKTIVSLADSNYFELLKELIESIKRFEQSKDIAICILDAGLSSDQKNYLSNEAKRTRPDIAQFCRASIFLFSISARGTS